MCLFTLLQAVQKLKINLLLFDAKTKAKCLISKKIYLKMLNVSILIVFLEHLEHIQLVHKTTFTSTISIF